MHAGAEASAFVAGISVGCADNNETDFLGFQA